MPYVRKASLSLYGIHFYPDLAGMTQTAGLRRVVCWAASWERRGRAAWVASHVRAG